jgi:hypothetical protein
MGYCGDDRTTWTSDHNYLGALDFLSGGALGGASFLRGAALAMAVEAAPAPAREPCLLVSGVVAGDRVELAPAYVVETAPVLPPRGALTLDLLDGAGARLSSVSFAAARVAAEEQGEPEQGHFAMALPLSAVPLRALQGLAVRRGEVEVARREAPGGEVAAPGEVAAEVRPASRRTHVSWKGAGQVEAMIRDPRSGEVLAFARGGAADVDSDAPELEVALSDGVRSGPPVRVRTR